VGLQCRHMEPRSSGKWNMIPCRFLHDSINPLADLPQIWELLFAEHIFGNDSEQDSLALMIKYLGPPPPELLERSQLREQYFDKRGK